MTPALFAFIAAWASGVFFHAGAERSVEPEPEEDIVGRFIDEHEFGRKFYDPGGPIGLHLQNLDEEDKVMQAAAKKWTQGTFEAMKAARRVLVQSTNQAQNILLHDGLKVNAAIKGKFQEETDNIRIDEKKLSQHSKDEKLEDLSPKYLGLPVRISNNYGFIEGTQTDPQYDLLAEKYRGLDGYIVGFNGKRGTWKVQPERLEDPENSESKQMAAVDLSVGEFEMQYDEDPSAVPGHHRYRNDRVTDQVLQTERIKALKRYSGADQHVHIDEVGDEYTKFREENKDAGDVKGHTGLVVNYSPNRKKFQVQPMRNDGMLEANDKYWLWLDEGTEFHRQRDLEGLEVTVPKSETVKAVVQSFVPGPRGTGGNFKVRIQDPVLTLSRDAVEKGRTTYYKKFDHNDNAQSLKDETVKFTLINGDVVTGKVAAEASDVWSDAKKYFVEIPEEVWEEGGRRKQKRAETKVIPQGDIREVRVLKGGQRSSTGGWVEDDVDISQSEAEEGLPAERGADQESVDEVH